MDKAKEIYSKMIKDEHDKLILVADFDKMQKIIDDLQRRIDKAISLIEVHTTSFGDLILEKQLVKILTDILKGDDTNE